LERAGSAVKAGRRTKSWDKWANSDQKKTIEEATLVIEQIGHDFKRKSPDALGPPASQGIPFSGSSPPLTIEGPVGIYD
jgi:hypothetical protein